MVVEVGQRYQLLEQLGQGGMGVVYKAKDRLQNQLVALKRVTVSASHLQFAERTNSAFSPDVALAHEFRTLASLRHPHIISVLDYGFDDEHKPYFTMEYLDNASTFLDALNQSSTHERLELAIQMLHALAYLHRRGLLHRDLKPENVLVTEGDEKRVKVLDFGVANEIQTNEAPEMIVGTFNYIAPEIFMGNLPSTASDLYSVGIMLYEVFHQRYPYEYNKIAQLINLVMTAIPVVDEPQDMAQVQYTIERLLAKSPDDRYQDANELITRYAKLIDKPELAHDRMIRESFLQAASFVGRDHELVILKGALEKIFDDKPNGQAFLIGGESGVGKSRLVEELRAFALVKGAWVLKGEGVDGGGLPYQLWRNVARRLVLSTDISDDEASILKELVPDIASLIGRDVQQAQELSGEATVERLSLTLLDLFRRQSKPIVLILSDLHWTSTSLIPLQYLLPVIGELPIMIVGSFRSDEQPELPEKLSEMTTIQLDRLSQDEIERLSASMLGNATPDTVVSFIQRHSEGNALFIIEVVRALAEHAGQLHNIGRLTLPQAIVTGGIESIIKRRIERVDLKHHEALKLAAVAGRIVDPSVLSHALSTEVDSNFFQVCAEASVLEMHDEQWRFTHSKLRDALIGTLSTQDLQTMNRRIAKATEITYPNDNARAHILTQHYLLAKDKTKSAEYGLLAARQMAGTSTYRDAVDLLQQVMILLQDDSDFVAQRIEVKHELAIYYEHLSSYDVASTYFMESLELAQETNDKKYIARNINGLGIIEYNQSNNEQALEYLDQALAIAREVDDKEQIALSLKHRSNVYSITGQYQKSDEDLREALAINMSENLQNATAGCLNNLGVNAYLLGDYASAKDYYKQALEIYTTIGYRSGIALCESNLGDVSFDEGDATQLAYYQRGLKIYREVGNQWGIALCLDNMGSTQIVMGNYEDAKTSFDESLEIARKIGDQYGEMYVLSNLAMLHYVQEEFAESIAYAEQSKKLATEMDDNEVLGTIFHQLAMSKIALGKILDAQEYLIQASQVADKAESDPVKLVVLAGIARLLRQKDQLQQATQLLNFLLNQDEIEDTNRRLFLLPMKEQLGISDIQPTSDSLKTIWDQFRLTAKDMP